MFILPVDAGFVVELFVVAAVAVHDASVAGQPVVVVAGQQVVIDVVAEQPLAVAGQPAVAVCADAGQHSVDAVVVGLEPVVVVAEQRVVSVVVVAVSGSVAAVGAELVGVGCHSFFTYNIIHRSELRTAAK